MIDLNKKRTPKELKALKQSVIDNFNNTLTIKQQALYLDEIEYKLTGRRYSDKDVLRQIEESRADISDMIGQVMR